MNTRNLLAALLAVFLAACSQTSPEPKKGGAELLAPFKTDLKAALSEGMQDGAVAAIAACNEAAPGIAQALSADGVRMGRSSHKLRNPDNAPPAWLVPVLDDYASGQSDLAPRSVVLEDGRTAYAEPIMMQPLCLNCHGEVLLPDVAARITELYPNDQATGFGVGDFRGVFWVEF